MKKMLGSVYSATILFIAHFHACAQGTLIYDQQSATGPLSPFGNDFFNIQTVPLTQSFVPTLSAIDFVQFELEDVPGNGNNGATIYVNLWTGSPNIRSATLLGSTASVYIPNGFTSDDLTLAGIANFYFSTQISLNVGQTYYLQPVILSGDSPFDIMVLGDVSPYADAYPSGQLYANGSSFDGTVDLWFREGVGAVPEPTTLALVALVGLLAFFRKRCGNVLLGAFLAVGIFTTSSTQAGIVYYLQSYGGFGSMPFPMNPYGDSVPMTEISPGTYLVEDRSANPLHATEYFSFSSLSETSDNGTNEMHPSYGFQGTSYTNGLWLEVLNTNNVNSNLWLRLHGTVGGDNYQLLSIEDLTKSNWNLGQILFSASSDHTDFSTLAATNTTKFYRAQHANPVMSIRNAQNSEEWNPTNASNPGQVGVISIQNLTVATNNITVYYQISGTAQNGVDYSNLTGTVVIPFDQGYAEIDIDPTATGLKPDQTVILTLNQNTNYLIDPANYSATNILYANPEVMPVAFGDLINVCLNTSVQYRLIATDPQNLPLVYTVFTYPAHGILSGTPPSLTYTPTNCYEGTDSFTFTASDGTWTSAPAAVNFIISDPVVAFPISAQTCRATPVSLTLRGGDSCGETMSYSLPSNPIYGVLSGTAPDLTYTPTNVSFTGTDGFSYIAFNECGDAATNTVTIVVGDANISATSQTLIAGTNRPLAITLNAADPFNGCGTDTTNYIYAVVSNPAHGAVSGTPPNVTYTPANNFEGQDSFTFAASDGVWTSAVATVTLKVTAGPILFHDCNPFGTAPGLKWMLDTNEQVMFPSPGYIRDFIIYRSATFGSNYTAIATNYYTGNASWLTYFDTNSALGETNYYVVTFEAFDSPSGVSVESPHSNEVQAQPQVPNLLVSADASWIVTTNLFAPTNVTVLQAPFSSYGTNQYPGVYPTPNTLWPVGATWSNHITVFIPSNSVPLSQVTYSIIIDNNCQLYLNNSNAPIESINHEGQPIWSAFKTFESAAPGLLHYGTNDIGVVIMDEGLVNYFSMIVSTDNCHGQ